MILLFIGYCSLSLKPKTHGEDEHHHQATMTRPTIIGHRKPPPSGSSECPLYFFNLIFFYHLISLLIVKPWVWGLVVSMGIFLCGFGICYGCVFVLCFM